MTFEITDRVTFFDAQSEYWRRVNESEGFNVEDIKVPPGAPGLMDYDCASVFGYPYIIDLYAKMGLHRYNMSGGTNLQLARVIKYNRLMNGLSSYYITLIASDPVSCLERPFLVRVDDNKHSRLALTVSVAQPRDNLLSLRVPTRSFSSSMETSPVSHYSFSSPTSFTNPFSSSSSTTESTTSFNNPLAVRAAKSPQWLPVYKLPEWPSEDAFTDSNRFYLFEGSELQDNDWIGLYLQLQVLLFSYDRVSKADVLKLKVVKAAIESMNEDVEPRNAKSAFVYVTFKGLAIRGMSEEFERRAVIRRLVNERTGCLSLLGGFSGEDHTLGFNPHMTTLEAFEHVQKAVRDGTFRISKWDTTTLSGVHGEHVEEKDL